MGNRGCAQLTDKGEWLVVAESVKEGESWRHSCGELLVCFTMEVGGETQFVGPQLVGSSRDRGIVPVWQLQGSPVCNIDVPFCPKCEFIPDDTDESRLALIKSKEKEVNNGY